MDPINEHYLMVSFSCGLEGLSLKTNFSNEGIILTAFSLPTIYQKYVRLPHVGDPIPNAIMETSGHILETQ